MAPTASTNEEDARAEPGSTPSQAPQSLPRSVLAPSAEAPTAHSAASQAGEQKGALDTIKDTLASALPAVAKPLVGAGQSEGQTGRDVKIGSLGILHPSVLKAFELDFPCSSLEFDVEPFL